MYMNFREHLFDDSPQRIEEPIIQDNPESENKKNFFNSEEDEEYSYYEDMAQNAKAYKQDETPFVPTIPRVEVQDLIADRKVTDKDPNTANISSNGVPHKRRRIGGHHSGHKRMRMNDDFEPQSPAKIEDQEFAYQEPQQPPPYPEAGIPYMHSPSFAQPEGYPRAAPPIQTAECFSCLNLRRSLLYYRKRFNHFFYFFSQKQLQELARQRDMYVQLLIQNLMLSKDRQLKYRNYWLLFAFAAMQDRATYQYPNLPKFSVPFIKHPITTRPMSFYPQLSIFQSPLLDLAQGIYKRLLCDHSPESVNSFLINCPLINVKYLPITKNSISNSVSRRKFTKIDDYLLQIGLEEYGYKEIQSLQKKWLPEKNVKEIKHRYKNLTCSKANENIIKTWKKSDEKPFTKGELEKLFEGFMWFGTTNKISLIGRYFLPHRSGRVIERYFFRYNFLENAIKCLMEPKKLKICILGKKQKMKPKKCQILRKMLFQ